MKVPQIDLSRQYELLKSEIGGAIDEVLTSGQFIMGRWVGEIEKAVAEISGTKHGIGVASGTDALTVALFACGLKPGDEVITTPFSFVSVAEIILVFGARPVFVDIDPKNFNLDVGQIEDKITDKTRAIVPVHLYGQSADMDPIMEMAKKRSIAVIEDACQAVGARYKQKPVGSIGTMACLSFYPTKNLGAYGDGGMILTNDDDLAEKAGALRKHGQMGKYSYKLVGFNSRLDSIQAAILLAKVGKLEAWNEARRKAAARYNDRLKDLPVEVPHVEDYAYHIYHQYTIKVDRRDDLRSFLSDKGIGTAVHYPLGLHLQEAYVPLGYKEGDLPDCDEASRRVISLPMFPEIEDSQIDYVCGAIGEFFGYA